MPDPAGLPDKEPSVIHQLLDYGKIILARALPMYWVIVIAYSWRVALVWSVILSVFYDRLVKSNNKLGYFRKY